MIPFWELTYPFQADDYLFSKVGYVGSLEGICASCNDLPRPGKLFENTIAVASFSG